MVLISLSDPRTISNGRNGPSGRHRWCSCKLTGLFRAGGAFFKYYSMKQFLHRLAAAYLSPFRWYRKKIGGTWFFVEDLEVSGIADSCQYWTQDPERDCKILKQENY